MISEKYNSVRPPIFKLAVMVQELYRFLIDKQLEICTQQEDRKPIASM